MVYAQVELPLIKTVVELPLLSLKTTVEAAVEVVATWNTEVAAVVASDRVFNPPAVAALAARVVSLYRRAPPVAVAVTVAVDDDLVTVIRKAVVVVLLPFAMSPVRTTSPEGTRIPNEVAAVSPDWAV
jgi:hypothetical protein